jgi:RNA polymerase sigma-70 factor (ECF subfamily)
MEPTPTAAALLGEADFVRGLAGSLVYDPAAADDIAQETLLTALENPPAHLSSTRGWLATVARNVSRQMGRSGARRHAREAKVARPEDAVPSTLELLEVEEVRSQVVEAVMRLDETDRSVVVLRYYEGLKPAAIAERMGLTAGAVSTRLHRAHKRLRETLDARHNGSRAAWVFALGPLLPAEPPAPLATDAPKTVPPAPPAAGGFSAGSIAASAAAVALVALVAVVPSLWPDSPPQPLAPVAAPASGATGAGGDVNAGVERAAADNAGAPNGTEDTGDTPGDGANAANAAGAEVPDENPKPADADSQPAPSKYLLAGRARGWEALDDKPLGVSVDAALPKNELGASFGERHPSQDYRVNHRYGSPPKEVSADGTFTADLTKFFKRDDDRPAPPMLVITLWHRGYLTAEYWISTKELAEAAKENPGAANGARWWADLEIKRASLLDGRVTTAGGRPLPDAKIGVYRFTKRGPLDRGGGPKVPIDNAGEFWIPAKPEEKLLVVAIAPGMQPDSVVVTAPASGRQRLKNFELQPEKVTRGSLVLSDGAPLAGVTITAIPVQKDHWISLSGTSMSWHEDTGRCVQWGKTETATDGSFALTELSDVPYTIAVDAKWKGTLPDPVVVTPPSDSPQWRITGGTVRVHLRHEGKTVRGSATFFAPKGAGPEDPVRRLLADGSAAFFSGVVAFGESLEIDCGVLPPGTYRLVAYGGKYKAQEIELTLRAGDRITKTFDMELKTAEPADQAKPKFGGSFGGKRPPTPKFGGKFGGSFGGKRDPKPKDEKK